jgi:hypothetical protein
MKLNLLPTYVSRGAGVRNGIIMAVILIMVSVFGAAALMKKASDDEAKALADVEANRSKAQQAVDVSNQADQILTKVKGPLLNVTLAKAMDAHNSVYPDFYDQIKQYIPNFFRINSLQATPIDDNSATVTMNGVIHTFQQYADLMLVLLRIPGAQSVSRSGYALNDAYVPPLIREDQVGRMIAPGKPRLTDKGIDRLDVMIAQAGETHFAGVGGFGTTAEPKVRGAMPEWQAVTVAVVVTKNLTTPDPRGTLNGAAAAFAGGGGAPAGG